MPGFLSSLGFSVLAVTLSFAVLASVVSPPAMVRTAPYIATEDGRGISYEVRGDANRTNCIIWMHGILSSRYESLVVDEGLLAELDAYVVSYDRPGYGESSMKKGRSYESAVADLEVLADGLGVERFFVAGVSGGGPYALAAGAIIPGRLRGILLLSAVGPDTLDAEKFAQRERPAWLEAGLRQPWALAVGRWLVETYAGGRALYSMWLEGYASTAVSRFSQVDSRCVRRKQSNVYTMKLIPESTRQATATALLQDLLLIVRPWTFNPTQIPAQLQSAVHIWHGTEDLQVDLAHAHAFKRMLPEATLEVVEGGGHLAYWACDAERQRLAFTQLLQSGLPA